VEWGDLLYPGFVTFFNRSVLGFSQTNFFTVHFRCCAHSLCDPLNLPPAHARMENRDGCMGNSTRRDAWQQSCIKEISRSPPA